MQGYTRMDVEIEPSIGAPSGGGERGGAGSGGRAVAGASGGGVGGVSVAGTQTSLPSGWVQTCHLIGMVPGPRRGGGAARRRRRWRTGEGK